MLCVVFWNHAGASGHGGEGAGETMADLSQHSQEYVAVFGVAGGGKEEPRFLSNENRAPMTATPGERGQESCPPAEAAYHGPWLDW